MTPWPEGPYDQEWYWRARLPERKGRSCRILARGALNSILIEFEDGTKIVTSRYAVRPRGTEAKKEDKEPLAQRALF